MINVPNIKVTSFDYKKMKEFFLNSINCLGNTTNDYYKEILPRIKIVKTKHFENGYAEVVENSKLQKVYITNKKIQNVDYIACCHEFGHIPYINNKTKCDYYEYSEVLSIFFEYLSCLYLYKDDAYDFFLKQRLKIAKDESCFYLDSYNCDYYENEYHYRYLENSKLDNLKYILSLDYVLNLIDIYNNDKSIIKELIDSVVSGESSFKEKQINLGIDDNCLKLIKELKKY